MGGARPIFGFLNGTAEVLAAPDHAARVLELARVLGECGFGDEARWFLLAAVHALGVALALEHRLPAPGDTAAALQAPLGQWWAAGLPVLKAYQQDPAADWKAVMEVLSKQVG